MTRPAATPDVLPVFFDAGTTLETLRELLAPAGLVVIVDRAGRMVASRAPAFIAKSVERAEAPRVRPFADVERERAPVLTLRRKAR